ncbi:MAG: hypothetical protein ACLGIR_06825 [Actinomycetes bacterium]
MRLRTLATTLLLVPAAALSTAAHVPDGCASDDRGTVDTSDDIFFCPTTAYLGGCAEAEAGKVYDPVTRGSVPLTLEKPTASFTTGAGCGTPEVPLFGGVVQETPYDFNVAGFVDEEINPRSMTVTLHDIYAGRSRQSSAAMNLSVRITVDGVSPTGTETLTNVSGDPFESPKAVTIPVVPTKSATGVSESLTFTIAGLDEVVPEGFFAAGRGAGRQIILTIGLNGLGEVHTLVWGASEIDSNISFNVPEKGPVYDAATNSVRSPRG